ncbi:MAG: hypothetical protein Q8L37_02215 [Candidatus Gottesmanbacteria bacterium]|nr:hypothetical protein [Candidatus Gottesmanbacteria bacterium]
MNIEQNWVLSLSRKLSFACIVLSVLLLFWRYPRLPPLLPLWYSKPWGVERLAHPLWLILLPVGSWVIMIINAFAARFLTRDMLIFTQLFAVTTLLVAILSLVTMAKIIFLVL